MASFQINRRVCVTAFSGLSSLKNCPIPGNSHMPFSLSNLFHLEKNDGLTLKVLVTTIDTFGALLNRMITAQ